MTEIGVLKKEAQILHEKIVFLIESNISTDRIIDFDEDIEDYISEEVLKKSQEYRTEYGLLIDKINRIEPEWSPVY